MFILAYKNVDGDVEVIHGATMKEVNDKLQAQAVEGRLDLEDWSEFSHAILTEIEPVFGVLNREFSTNLIPYLEVER